MSAIIHVRTHHPGPFAGPLVCPVCGNREVFYGVCIGDIPQRFSVDPTNGERDWDSHSNEGEGLDIEIEIQCGECEAIVAERDVTITVGAWRTPGATRSPAERPTEALG